MIEYSRSTSVPLFGDDPSVRRSELGNLTNDQKSRLIELLDQYLVGLERGEPLDTTKLCKANPDLAAIFQQYLPKLDMLHRGTELRRFEG